MGYSIKVWEQWDLKSQFCFPSGFRLRLCCQWESIRRCFPSKEKRKLSSTGFWSHWSRSADIDSSLLSDLHKFLFETEIGGRVHFPLWKTTWYEHWQFKYCTLWFTEKWKAHLSFLEILSLQHGSYILSCTMKEPLAISLVLFSLSAFWNFNWLHICWKEKTDKILYLSLLITVLVL